MILNFLSSVCQNFRKINILIVNVLLHTSKDIALCFPCETLKLDNVGMQKGINNYKYFFNLTELKFQQGVFY
jgi:hypothetical protein